MSAGAVFKLIANDGKADRLIMATALLNQRIQDVMCSRRREGMEDITPTLADLERTHILYVNAHFKPYAAIGFEYQKQQTASGNANFGSSVTFSIAQFGDFFHDMVVRLRTSSCQAAQGTAPTQPSAQFPANTLTQDYNLVDIAGNNVAGGSAYRNMVRYCEFPGNRIFKKVAFDVNGNPLDSYDSMVPVMLEKFGVAPNKRTGYNRLVGQEVPMEAYSAVKGAPVVDANAASTGVTINKFAAGQNNQTVGLFAAATSLVSAVPSQIALNAAAGVDVSRQLKKVVNGPQTPKPIQAPLEIWNKLRFWFCDDVRLAIPSVSIPYGQRYISIELEQASQLVYEVPSLFLRTAVESPAAAGDYADLRTVTYTPIQQLNGIVAPTIEKMELYINNIFVNPEVHDIFIERIGFSLIRVYVQHKRRTTAAGDELLSSIKWPVEYFFVGMRPAWNITNPTQSGATIVGNQNAWRDWHRLTLQVNGSFPTATRTELSSGAINNPSVSVSSDVQDDQYYLSVPTVDSMSLTSHGITIYDNLSSTFFNQYAPFHFGGANLNTPEDLGALFVNMALFPRTYQPSGHLNVSRARETYLKFVSTYISSTAPVDLEAVAVAINFLLVTDGSAVLRYST